MDMNNFIDLIEQKKKLFEISKPIDFKDIKVGDHVVFKGYVSDIAHSGYVKRINTEYLFVDTMEGFIYKVHNTFRIVDEDWDLGL